MQPISKACLALVLLFLTPRWVEATPPFIVTESAIPLDKNMYRFEAGLQLSKIPFGPRNAVTSFSFQYGLIHNLQIEAKWPYLFVEEDQKGRSQFGDILLKTKILFLKGREASPISIASMMAVKVPTASRNDLANTTGEADVGFSLLASKEISPYTAHLNLSHTYIGNPPQEERPDRRDYSFGLEWNQNPSLSFFGELFGSMNTGSGASNEQWSAALGAFYWVRPEISVDGALGVGLSERAADSTLNLRVSYLYK